MPLGQERGGADRRIEQTAFRPQHKQALRSTNNRGYDNSFKTFCLVSFLALRREKTKPASRRHLFF